jgi:predicted HTH domain antitoxin
MGKIILNVPESLAQEGDKTVHFIAAKLYEAGKLSLGEAAEMCNLDKIDFPAVLAEFDVNYIQYGYADVMADVARINS